MKLFPQEENHFGLDIGASSIKLTQLRQVHAQASLITYGDIELEDISILSDSQIDQDKISDLIAQLADDAKVTTKNVVASLSASQSYSAIITTPKLSHEELAESIKFQADKAIPVPIDQVKLDWSVISEDEQKDELEILIVAANNSVATKYLNIIQKSGLELLALEINQIAQIRSLMSSVDLQANIVLVDIGVNNTDISVIEKSVPKLIRTVQVGFTTLKKTTMSGLGLDEKQAVEFLQKFGVDQTKVEGKLYNTLKPVVDHLTEEINKSIAFYKEKFKKQNIEKIIITGGTSATPNLPLYIANSTGLSVEIGNPWQNVSYPKEIEPSLHGLSLNYATAVGLALRGF